MNFGTLRYEKLGAVLRTTANRPEVLNAQSLAMAFKNYMLTIPHRQALGTYGAAARAKGVKERIEARDGKFGDVDEHSRRPS
jgi:hypothetical protein